MRRGLMAWNPDEVPRLALDKRLERLRTECVADGIDAFVAYTNIARGGAVWWLTGFTPYWNESLLYAPPVGDMLFTTALSKRVADWIGSVMPAGHVTTTPKPSILVGQNVARDEIGRLGILELEDFPAGHAQAIQEAAPGAELVDATAAFARARSHVDDVERILTTKADRLASEACRAVAVASLHAREFIAPAEAVARLGGAEECFAGVAADLDRSVAFLRTEHMGPLGATFAARLSLAYKGAWTRRTVSFARDPVLQAEFDRAAATLAAFAPMRGEPLGTTIAEAFSNCGRVSGWVVEQPRGSYPLGPVADHVNAPTAPVPETPFLLNVEAYVAGARWIGARMVAL